MKAISRQIMEPKVEKLPKISLNIRPEIIKELDRLLVTKKPLEASSTGPFLSRTEAITYSIECQLALLGRKTRVLFRREEFGNYFQRLLEKPVRTDKMLLLTHQQASSHKSILEQHGSKLDEIAKQFTIAWIAPSSVRGEFERANLKNITLYYYPNETLGQFLSYTAIISRYEKSCIVSDLVAGDKAALFFDDVDISRDYYNIALWFLVFGLVGNLIEEGPNANEEIFKKLYGDNDKSLLNKIMEGAKEARKKNSLRWMQK